MTHASLFSGIGGAEVAASMMGWQNLFHCEIQEFPRRVLDYWFPNSESYEDIKNTDFSQWRGKVDVLTGGFPCQPFSVAGRRDGAADDRYLWPEMLRAIREVQPTWVVGENVSGIATMVESGRVTKMGRTDHLFEENFLYREESRFTLDRICADLECAGFSVQPFVIPACAVGAPHRRDRVWIVAHANGTRQRGRKDEPKPVAWCERTPNPGTCRAAWSASISTAGGDGWRHFPTQSPVCGRNDGLPFDVDSLAISFARWRRESIRAYGNAWVPQVAYEIFRAIEIEEHKKYDYESNLQQVHPTARL